jgi:N-acetylmuramoyl-L-alanine amidase
MSSPKVVIGIDPGHGGDARGTSLPCGVGSIDEADWALAQARRVEAEIHLAKLPVATVLLRHSDQYLPLSERGRLAKVNNCTLVLSLHVNAGPPTLRGLSCFVLSGDTYGKTVAGAILQRRPAELVGTCRALVECSTADGWTANALAVIGSYHCPCVLTEHGFARTDTKALLNISTQQALALAQVAGVRAYLEAINGRTAK